MKSIIRKHWQPLALIGITLLGLALRLYGLNWDDGNSFHPDERQILFHVVALRWPDSLAQFFDPVNSPLNPHFFAYGSFPMYLLAAVGNILAHFFPALGSFANLTLVGRVLSAIFDSGTILLTGWLGLLLAEDLAAVRQHAWKLALLAAALVAFTPFQLQLAHFYAVDSVLLFFVVLTVLACVALVNTDAPVRWSIIAGLGYGLALATKFSAAPLIVPLIVAVILRWMRRDLFSALSSFFFAIAATGLSFLIAMPYALLDLSNFVQQVAQQGDLARGALDLPYVRQFAGTTPYIYEAENMLFWGLGLMLGLAAFAGLLWILWRVRKREASLWLVVLSWVFVYGALTGSFYVKFMRYMLPLYPFLTLMAAAFLIAWLGHERNHYAGYKKYLTTALPYAAIVLVLAGTAFQGLALLNVYSVPNTRIQASRWIYVHLRPGSVLTYEQWDDPLPVQVDNNDPSEYQQLTYPDANGQPETGLDLYGNDTLEKAQQLATLLPKIDAITMATDRLDKSIPRLPARYPLTIHYYQLLFSGQLGFHLAAQFSNHPNLFGITLDDSSADESYSVFDHPTSRIFVRDNPYPYTSAQLFDKLLQGVQLPPSGAGLSGDQKTLLLSPQQIADDQQSPPLGIQFPENSISNAVPVFIWWLILILLGLLVFPLVFFAFRGLADRGYIFSKMLGILILAYLAWMLADLHILPFSRLSLLFVLVILLLCAIAMLIRQRQAIAMFLRQHWRLLLVEEVVFTVAFLAFVGIRSLDPDLWHIYMGGEKPMELAFLNAVLRSPYMPPIDPWFSGGYINYYYYGYIVIGALTKLTAIVPTTAFNLAIPTLFALTFTGVVSLVYSLTRRFSIALLGGYFAALIGNFDGLAQLKAQLIAAIAHTPPIAFNYWQSSRIIPFTINEFPFWSFLFADLHPHVIDMPFAVLMLGIAAALLLSGSGESTTPGEQHGEKTLLYILAAFVFGTIACINPWDMPIYSVILGAVLIIREIQEQRQRSKRELFISLGFTLVRFALICGAGYLLYWPFYASYQELYVNGLGLVKLGTSLSDYLTISGLWIFLTLSFFLFQLYRWWTRFWASQPGLQTGMSARIKNSLAWSISTYSVLCGMALIGCVLLGLKVLLAVLIGLGAFLCVVSWKEEIAQRKYVPGGSVENFGGVGGAHISALVLQGRQGTAKSAVSWGFSDSVVSRYLYLMLLMGLCISLGVEIVYVRDFLDGGDYERMNTVFKFSIQAWLCFAVGGALVVQRLWDMLVSFVRRAWSVILIALVLGCSVFLVAGTAARVQDHQGWALIQPPVQSANYTSALDGFAFVRAWYPGDAQAIEWLNNNVAGSPVLLEAAVPVSYQWFNRVSVYTGLPDVLGWPDHVSEQRYSEQTLNRLTDIGIIYTTSDKAQALELLHFYHVRYIYVGELERQAYAQQSSAGLDKFDAMVGDTLRLVYRSDGVSIYEVV